MRVVFMGSPPFAVPSLKALAAKHDVVAVYTQPDRVRGRGRGLTPTPVKLAAIELGIEVRTPPTLKDPQAQSDLASLKPDVICVAAYGQILPREVLELPRLGCVNVHASLLPRHRGAAPVHRAILQGDETTGVSIMRIEEGLDTGPYATVVTTPVDDLSAEELTERLADLGARALIDTLCELEAGTVVWTEQDDSKATYAAKITDADVALSPDLTVRDALRRIRASGPSARSKVRVNDAKLVVTSADRSLVAAPRGGIVADRDGLHLGFADGAILAREVRPEGRATMRGSDFARGARLDGALTWETA